MLMLCPRTQLNKIVCIQRNVGQHYQPDVPVQQWNDIFKNQTIMSQRKFKKIYLMQDFYSMQQYQFVLLEELVSPGSSLELGVEDLSNIKLLFKQI